MVTIEAISTDVLFFFLFRTLDAKESVIASTLSGILVGGISGG